MFLFGIEAVASVIADEQRFRDSIKGLPSAEKMAARKKRTEHAERSYREFKEAEEREASKRSCLGPGAVALAFIFGLSL